MTVWSTPLSLSRLSAPADAPATAFARDIQITPRPAYSLSTAWSAAPIAPTRPLPEPPEAAPERYIVKIAPSTKRFSRAARPA